jgi:hypothetical protein
MLNFFCLWQIACENLHETSRLTRENVALKRNHIIVIFLFIFAAAIGTWLLLHRAPRPGSLTDVKNRPELSPYFLSALKLDRPVAKVGSNELRTDELRDFLLLTYQGQMTQVTLPKPDLVAKISVALDRLIDEELLAQAALKEGLKSSLEGVERKQDLAKKYLESQLAKESPVNDVEMREFYRNHGEKFFIPAGVQLREFFVPFTGEKDKSGKTDSALDLAKNIADQVAKGDSVEELGKKYVPDVYRERIQVHLYKGGVIEPTDDQKVLALRPGQTAGPFRTEGGFSVFQAISQERSRFIPFYEAKAKIQSFLQAQRVEVLRKKLVDQLKQRVPIQRYKIENLISVS